MEDVGIKVNGFAHEDDTSERPVTKSIKSSTESWNGNGAQIADKISSGIIPSLDTEKEIKSVLSSVTNPDVKSHVEYNDGPDQVIPSDLTWTCNANGSVKIRGDEKSLKERSPISVPGLLHKTCTEFPERIALSVKNTDGSWTEIKYKQYEEDVRTVAKGFIKLGLERYCSVAIIGFNSIEWFYSDLGAILAGGFAAGMYTTNSPEACFHCLESSKSNICVVEDEKQLQKILEVKSRLPLLKAIIQYTGEPKEPGVLSWAQLMKIGKEESDDKLNQVLKTIAVNECCTLVYTSGTEGKPKAVMLSHDNLTWDSAGITKQFSLTKEDSDVVISYLPLSHVAAQVTDIYCPLTLGAKVVFADKDALKGSLKNTMVEARPTIFMGVPRVWEKMYETLTSIGKQASGVKRTLATWAKMATLQHHEHAISNSNASESYRYKFYRWLIFDRIKQRMGLDRCKYFISAAAPISEDIKKYFMSIDILLVEAFGMSECAGAHTAGIYSKYSLSGVGITLPGAETKLDMKDEQGEICMRGRHVFMGYLNEPEKTKNALDDEGWLHSGDIGTLDDNGNLYITGRSKELLITAGGENVAPVLIEQTVKSELPVISNAVLIGDKRKFLSILLTLRTEADSEGKPTDKLVSDVRAWCEKLSAPCETISDILNNPDNKKKVSDAIQQGLNNANKKAISRAQNIQKFSILPVDFSVGDELGPTLKIKRNVVYQKYTDVIEEFYKEANPGK